MYPILNYSNVEESNGIKVKNDTDLRGHFSVFSYALDTQGFLVLAMALLTCLLPASLSPTPQENSLDGWNTWALLQSSRRGTQVLWCPLRLLLSTFSLLIESF